MEKSEEMDHASKYFWSPMNLSSGSSSSGEINDEEHVDHEELDEEYFCDYGNLPSLNGAYMRALLKTVNDKWDQEPIPAEERVSKVQFMPDECLVTVSYFITDEENRDYESSVESSMPCSTEEIVTLKPPEEVIEVIELLEIVENENGIVEEDLFPDDFLDENPDNDEDDIEIIQLVEKISLVSSVPGSEEFDPATGNTNLISQKVSQDLIDLQTDDEQSQVTGPFSVTFSNSDAGTVSQLQPKPAAFLENMEPAVIFNDPSIHKPDYSKFSSMFETALHPGVSVTNIGSLSDSSSSESISSAGCIAHANNVTGTNATKKPLSQIELDVSAEVARLNESLNNSNNNPESEPVVLPPSSNPAVELIKKLSSQRLKASGSLEITGVKLIPRTEPEVINVASEAKTTSVTSVRESKSGATVVIRPRTEKATSISDHSHSQASSKVSVVSSHRSSAEEDQFLEGIKAVFNKKSLLALNKLYEPKRLPQAKAQILQRNISRTMLTNIFRPEFVQLLFDNEPPPQQSAASKWATRPVYNETLGYTVANGDVHNKERFPNLKKPPFSVSVAPAPTPAMKAGSKKKKSEELKAKASVPNRSVSAKEKVSKLRSTINRLSPRPATTGSKNMNRISAEPSGLRLNASDQALNNTIERIRLEDEKKRQSFNSWLDKKSKESHSSRPSTVPAIQADRWITRMKLDTKKAENEILARIKSDNNPRMMETYRAYTHAGYNLHPTTMATYAHKKSLGTKSSFTHHH